MHFLQGVLGMTIVDGKSRFIMALAISSSETKTRRWLMGFYIINVFVRS